MLNACLSCIFNLKNQKGKNTLVFSLLSPHDLLEKEENMEAIDHSSQKCNQMAYSKYYTCLSWHAMIWYDIIGHAILEQLLEYFIPIKIHAPLGFALLIFVPLIFAHPQISLPFNFRAPLLYCNSDVFSFIRCIFSSPFNFPAFLLCELAAPFNYCAG